MYSQPPVKTTSKLPADVEVHDRSAGLDVLLRRHAHCATMRPMRSSGRAQRPSDQSDGFAVEGPVERTVGTWVGRRVSHGQRRCRSPWTRRSWTRRGCSGRRWSTDRPTPEACERSTGLIFFEEKGVANCVFDVVDTFSHPRCALLPAQVKLQTASTKSQIRTGLLGDRNDVREVVRFKKPKYWHIVSLSAVGGAVVCSHSWDPTTCKIVEKSRTSLIRPISNGP